MWSVPAWLIFHMRRMTVKLAHLGALDNTPAGEGATYFFATAFDGPTACISEPNLFNK
jgi:hypothetical protein